MLILKYRWIGRGIPRLCGPGTKVNYRTRMLTRCIGAVLRGELQAWYGPAITLLLTPEARLTPVGDDFHRFAPIARDCEDLCRLLVTPVGIARCLAHER